MSTLPPIDRLDTLTDDALARLRQQLALAGFDEAVLADAETLAPGLLDPLRRPLLHEAWNHAPTPARDLAVLFCFDGAVVADRIERALGTDVVAALIAAGVLVYEGYTLRSLFVLSPMVGVWVLADDLHHAGDAVMGPGPTTHRLAQMIPSPAPARVLDVGCGAGSLALLAARLGATESVGVDIAPRAVAIARFNARLNSVRARFEVSDLFAAVEGQRFDLVISQPAFIAAPPDVESLTFAHGGPMGDELAMRLFRDLPRHLASDGMALVLVESAVRPGVGFHTRVREAMGRAPLDLLMLAARGQDPSSFSAAWASILDPSLGERWKTHALRYRAHLRHLGIEAFTQGLAMVTSVPGATAARYTIALPVNGLRGFDAEALWQVRTSLDLAARTDSALTGATVRANGWADYVEERPRPDSTLEPRWVAKFTHVALADRELSEPTWVLLGLLDQGATVGDAVQGFAEVCGAAPDDVRDQVLTFVRESLVSGLLIPG